MYSGEEVKLEDPKECILPVCFACLTSSRVLTPLGGYAGLFCKLFDNAYLHQAMILLCWECTAVLKKVKLFKEKVDHAQMLLNLFYLDAKNLGMTPDSLSTLAISAMVSTAKEPQIFSEQLTVDVKLETPCGNSLGQKEKEGLCETEVQNVKTEALTLPALPTNIETQNEPNQSRTDPANPDTEPVDSENPGKPIPKAYRPVKQRKLKFKWVDSDVKIQKIKAAKKVPVALEELPEWLERDRESEFFKNLEDKCEKCVVRIAPDKMSQHEKDHCKTTAKSVVCKVCQLTFYTEKNLSNHTIKVHSHLLECTVCGHKCYSRDCMVSHIGEHKRNVQCRKCKQNFLSTHAFYLHYRTVHCDYECHHCGKRCDSKKNIEAHIVAKHLPITCKQCNRSYKHYHSYRLHVDRRHARTHARAEEAFCVPCNKHFIDVASYRGHLRKSRAHAAERPPQPVKEKPKERVPCPECGNTYADKFYMTSHYLHVHKHQSPYRCEHCGKQFVSRSRMSVHVRTKHEGVRPAKNKFCNVCGRGFSTKPTLENHMRTHTGERPYQCEHCAARFTQRSAMQTHVRGVHLKKRSLDLVAC